MTIEMLHAPVQRTSVKPTEPVPCRRLVADPEEPGYAALATVMAQFSDQIGADGALVTLQDAGDRRPTLVFAGGVCAGGLAQDESFVRSSCDAAADYRWRPIDHNAPLRWQNLTCGRREWSMLSVPMPGDGGSVLTVSALFASASVKARVAAEAMVARLRPLMAGFMKLWSLRGTVQHRLDGLASALNQSDVGILVLDRDAALLFTNRAGTTLLDAGNGLRRKGGSIGASELADSLRLQVAIGHVLDGDDRVGGRARRTPIVALRRSGKLRPLMVSVLPPDRPPVDAEDAAAILYVFDPELDVLPLLQPACRIYALSPVETRLACLLSGGASVGEAAVAMRVKEQTARTYLKQVFLKTGTNRQADLVRVMLSSIVRTAQGADVEIV